MKDHGDNVSIETLRDCHVRQREIAGLQTTETCYPPYFNVPKHAHDFACFYFLLKGKLTESFSRHKRDVTTLKVVLTPAGEMHSHAFNELGGQCFLVELTAAWVDRISHWSINFENSANAQNSGLVYLAIKIYREFRHGDRSSSLAIEGLVLEILAEVARQKEGTPRTSVPNWLRSAKELLHDRLSDTVSLSEIAQTVGVHPVHLARTFRREFGCSLGEYQRCLRVDHASHQLVTSDRPLADIALTAGFSDQSHFSKVFKRRTGMTPGKFRASFGLH